MPTETKQNTQEPLLAKEASDGPPQISLFKGQVILNPTITKVNFYTFILWSLFGTSVLLPIHLLQSPLLLEVYHMSLADQASLSSALSICNIVLHIFLGPILGVLCDRTGRKPFLVIGVSIMCIGTLFLPNLPDPLVPYWIGVHLIQFVGIICMTSVPLLADYIDYETKGRVAGIMGVISYIGNFFATWLNASTDFKKDIKLRFYQFGIAGLVFGILLSFGLKGGNYHKKLFNDRKLAAAKKKAGLETEEIADPLEESPQELIKETEVKDQEANVLTPAQQSSESTDNSQTNVNININQLSINDSVVDAGQGTQKPPTETQTQPLAKQSMTKRSMAVAKFSWKVGLNEAKNPWILAGFVCGFLSSSKMGLGGLNMINYVVYLSDESHLNQYYELANKQTLAGFFCVLFFGFFADKWNKFRMILFVVISSVAGDVLLILMPSPFHPMAYGGMALFGMSSAGMMVFGSQLLSKYANPKLRASIHAVGGIFSMFGTILISVIGVYLNQYNPRIPFFMFLGSAFIGLVMLTALYVSKKKVFDDNY